MFKWAVVNEQIGATWFSFDPSDGSLTDINTNTARQIHAMVFVPEPRSLWLTACGAISIAALVAGRNRSRATKLPA